MRKRWRLWAALLLTVLWLGFIFSRSAKSAELSSAESESLLDLARRLFPALAERLPRVELHRLLRKLAHFTEYSVLGALLQTDCLLLGGRRALWPLLLGLGAACADEYLQTFFPGRSGALRDVLLDLAGVALGVGLTLLLRRRKERTRRGT